MIRPKPHTKRTNRLKTNLIPSKKTVIPVCIALVVVVSIIGMQPLAVGQNATDKDVSATEIWSDTSYTSSEVRYGSSNGDWVLSTGSGNGDIDLSVYASNGSGRTAPSTGSEPTEDFSYMDGKIYLFYDESFANGRIDAYNQSGTRVYVNNTFNDVPIDTNENTNTVYSFVNTELYSLNKSLSSNWEANIGKEPLGIAVNEQDKEVTVFTNNSTAGEVNMITFDNAGTEIQNTTLNIDLTFDTNKRNFGTGDKEKSTLDVYTNGSETKTYYAGDDTVYEIDIDSGKVSQTYNVDGKVYVNWGSVPRVSPDGDYIAFGYRYTDNVTIHRRSDIGIKETNVTGVEGPEIVDWISRPDSNQTIIAADNNGAAGYNLTGLKILPKQRISGQVRDGNGNGIDGATVYVENASSGDVETTQTNAGGFYEINKRDGYTYDLTAEKKDYFNKTHSVVLSGSDVTQDFVLDPTGESLQIKTRNYLKHGQTTAYEVWFTEQFSNGSSRTRVVTGQSTVTSANTTVLTVDQNRFEITATSNIQINNRTNLTATYTNDSTTYEATQNVTVANATVSNLKILPTVRAYSVALSDWTIFVLLLAAMMGVVGARLSTAFGGLAFSQSVILVGWFGNYVGTGVTMASVFVAMFIGLNLAANIDYTVRQ